jgi:hypothetical protein
MQHLLYASLILLGASVPALAQGTTAVLADGRVLTIKQPLEIFITEGPIWDINTAARSVTVTGKTVTIPATVNGAAFRIEGTAVTDANGQTVDAIGAHNFTRLLDENAVGRDVTPLQSGAVRSLFSTMENLRQDALRPLTRNLTAQQAMEANYFATARDLIPLHPTVLAPTFGSMVGMVAEENTGWVYPATSGGTFKSAGHVYLDAAGNSFLIPDDEAVIELSENVAGGFVTSVHPGGNGVPPSFTMGNLLVVYNQDPRFPASTLGLVGSEIPRNIFLQQAVGQEITVVGYMVSEHVLFANEVETTLVDPTAPIAVVPQQWLFKNSGNEIRIRGIVDRPQGITLSARILNQTFPITLVADPLTAGATFDFRSKGQLNVALVTQVTLEARYVGAPVGTPLAFQQTYLRSVVAP